MDWYKFYAARINSTYQQYFEQRYEPFLDAIKQLKYSQGILELGCGIGSVSKAVGGKYEGFDIDPMMAMLANKNTQSQNFRQGDIFKDDWEHSTLYKT